MFFERLESSNEKAILVHIDFTDDLFREELDEFQELVISSGATIVEVITGKKKQPNAKTFVGSGKLQEIHEIKQTSDSDLVIFNHALSPAQERNIERVIQCRVLDRTGLILDIFAKRARTYEGKLQVELAQLQHLSTRLIRGWTHLERQKGGIGLRGPGETQLETDRRLIRERIKSINKRLEKVRKQRSISRRNRDRAHITTISLVGYTNAGKSSLFRKLTDNSVYVADQLFATLDPTLRKIELPHTGSAILVDTVGFIRHLPHQLVEAFRATLEESRTADLLLHIIDSHNPDRIAQIEQVENVLQDIEADKLPCLQVYNKIDLLNLSPRIERSHKGKPQRVWVSAKTGLGIDLLKKAIAELIGLELIEAIIHLNPSQSALRATLYQQNAIMDEQFDQKGNYELRIKLPKHSFNSLIPSESVDTIISHNFN